MYLPVGRKSLDGGIENRQVTVLLSVKVDGLSGTREDTEVILRAIRAGDQALRVTILPTANVSPGDEIF